MDNNDAQTIRDNEHLKVLSICYYILAGLSALSTVLLIGYAILLLFVGGAIASENPEVGAGAMIFVAMFVGVGVLITAAWTAMQFYCARNLKARRSRGFCQFAAALTCLSVPLGTVLGVFTFVVLSRPSVRGTFQG